MAQGRFCDLGCVLPPDHPADVGTPPPEEKPVRVGWMLAQCQRTGSIVLVACAAGRSYRVATLEPSMLNDGEGLWLRLEGMPPFVADMLGLDFAGQSGTVRVAAGKWQLR